MSEREDSLSQLRQQIDALTCDGCRNQEPTTVHDGTPESLKALKGKKMHSACGICTAKGDVIIPLVSAREASIVKAAYGAAERTILAGQVSKLGEGEIRIRIAKQVRTLTPESALIGAQIAELEARRDQAQAGVKVIQGLRMISPSPIGSLHGAGWNDSIGHAERHLQAHVADLESQLQRLTAELAKVEGVMPQPAKLDHPKR